MKSPIERVARALCSADGHPENIQFEGKPMWQSYLPNARKAIEAMREPSALMLESAGEEERWDGKFRSSPENEAEAASVWRTMIDTALAEGA